MGRSGSGILFQCNYFFKEAPMLRQRVFLRTIRFFLATGVLSLLGASPSNGDDALEEAIGGKGYFLEAEQFDELGGWKNDCQFMDQMGSPFLLAHGLGQPVEDAVTSVEFDAGEYRVWIRTRDWVATWDAPGAPGRFRLLVDGRPLETTFGTEGARWHWQDGGVVKITEKRGSTRLAVDDLTGFAGRCDAILFCENLEYRPPDRGEELERLRTLAGSVSHEPSKAGDYDMVVVGGGIAGTCAAISGARHGLEVALIQDRPMLGGNNSSEVRVWLQGARNLPPFPHIGDTVAELEQERAAHYGPSNTAAIYEDGEKIALVRMEENIDLFLNHRANDIVMAEGSEKRIAAVIAQHTKTGRRLRFSGDFFADCTGDGCLAPLAGADYEMTVPDHMGRCNLWNVVDTGKRVDFPNCPWALDLSEKPFPGRKNHDPLKLGGWYWESGFAHDPFERSEYIRDWNFRAAYGAWDALKNVDGAFATYRLNWMAWVSGKRESRRLLGDVILDKQHLMEQHAFDDGCVPTGWKIDLHLPDPRYVEGFEGDAFISRALFTDYPRPFWSPYRCLYSRNISNLFMAGRDISVTHEALGSVRVMRTGGCMGEVVGMAASVAKKHRTDPRGVYHHYLEELLALFRRPEYAKQYAMPPSRFGRAVGENLAPEAVVNVSGRKDPLHGHAFLNDGLGEQQGNAYRWLSNTEGPIWAEWQWKNARRVIAVRVVSGYQQNGETVAPIEDFRLEYRTTKEGSWDNLMTVRGNDQSDWEAKIPIIEAQAMRLVVEKTQEPCARIWEIAAYAPKP
jgi:hypothetical protein